MVLTMGTRLGSYEIVSPLGRGWDGEVYKAAARRIAFTNSAGAKRRAERAPSGTSNVTVAIVNLIAW